MKQSPIHRGLLWLLLFQWNSGGVAFSLYNLSYERDLFTLAASNEPSQQPGNRRRTISSRSTAAFALNESFKRSSVIAIRVLENDPAYKSLEIRDRAFARLLLTTAERRHGQIEKVIKKVMDRANAKKVRFSHIPLA